MPSMPPVGRNNSKPNSRNPIDTKKAAKVKFIFAKYGYGKINKKYKNKIKNIKEVIKFN
jgi:hypothetical protein